MEDNQQREPQRKWKKPTTRGLEEYLVPNLENLVRPQTARPTHTTSRRNVLNEPSTSKKGKKITPLKKRLQDLRMDETKDELVLLPIERQLDDAVLKLIKTLKKYQDRLWKKSQEKARAHRRLVFGINEGLKHLVANGRVSLVVIARNIDKELNELTVTPLLIKLKTECSKHSIPIIQASTKMDLSKACGKFPYTNVITVLDLSSAEEYVCDVYKLFSQCEFVHDRFPDQSSLFA